MSVRGITDEAGTLTDTYVFDAFGNEVARTGTTDNSYGYRGEEQDETGLYYLRARYMDPSTGTFTTMDTYAGRLADPMSLHKYMYANANPVMNIDPSGHTNLAETNSVVAIITIFAEVSTGIVYSILGDIYGLDKSKPSYWIGMFVAMILAAVLAYFVAGAFLAGVTIAFTGKILLGLLSIITGLKCSEISCDAYSNGFILYGEIFELASITLQGCGTAELLQGLTEVVWYKNNSKTPYNIVYEADVGNGGSRSAHRNAANRQFYNEMINNPNFRDEMNEYFGYDVVEYMESGSGRNLINPSRAYVWHHPVDNRNAVQLISARDHTNPEYQPFIHPGRFGRGGFAIHYN